MPWLAHELGVDETSSWKPDLLRGFLRQWIVDWNLSRLIGTLVL